VIVDLLFPIARDCSKSTYLRFVEICIWNCWTASPCSLPLNIVVACLGNYGSSIPYFKSTYCSDCIWSRPLSLVLELILVGQRVSICSRSCSDPLQGNKLNTFFVFDCERSRPLPLVHVHVSAGKRVNIWSHFCSDLLQGNNLNTFVSDCEWSQPLPLLLVLVSVGQRVNIWSRSCSDLLQGNKLNTFVSLVQINYKVLIWFGIHYC
jgi:hypothetical protein